MKAKESRLAYFFFITAFFLLSCAPIPRKIEFKSTRIQKKYISDETVKTRWCAFVDDDDFQSENYSILIRNGDTSKAFDPCTKPKKLAKNVDSLPGTLSTPISDNSSSIEVAWRGRIWAAVGQFKIDYKEKTPSLETAINDIRRLIAAARAQSAECQIEWKDPSRSKIQSIRGHIMTSYGTYCGDACSGRKN